MLIQTKINCKVKNIFLYRVVYVCFLYLFMKEIVRQISGHSYISPTKVGEASGVIMSLVSFVIKDF